MSARRDESTSSESEKSNTPPSFPWCCPAQEEQDPVQQCSSRDLQQCCLRSTTPTTAWSLNTCESVSALPSCIRQSLVSTVAGHLHDTQNDSIRVSLTLPCLRARSDGASCHHDDFSLVTIIMYFIIVRGCMSACQKFIITSFDSV